MKNMMEQASGGLGGDKDGTVVMRKETCVETV